MMKPKSAISLLLLLCSTSTATSSATNPIVSWIDDLITELPDYGKTPTPHFSGYLDGSAGCDTATNGPVCNIHYWLALAEDKPESAPVVLWLNGGPGASSILGFLQELGPLMMAADGRLMDNPYGWTRHVNLLAIEAPIGVGYSYCSRQVNGKPCKNTDRYTASTSRAALVNFFEKYPELAANDFYITGESYAGVYIPTLTKEILDHTNINIRGIAVGDPCTDNVAQEKSMDSLWYAHKNGFVDDEIFNLLWHKCSARLPNLMTRGGKHHVMHTLNQELTSIKNKEERKRRAVQLFNEVILNHKHNTKLNESPECTLAFRKFLLSSSNGLSQSWKDLYIDDYSLFAPVSDLEDEQMEAYMSRKDVRKALHVDQAPVTSFSHHGKDVGFDYTKEYNACNWSDEIVLNISMVDIYKKIVPRLDRTWIYNGDADPCVSYEGTRLAVKQIQLNELDGGSYRPWFYNQTAADVALLAAKSALFGPNLVAQNMGSQFGGEVTDYEEGLKFVTFHGSGHMVPQFRPQSALHFLKKFIDGDMLAPLLPMNATLEVMSEREFNKAAKEWTENARSRPYVTEVEAGKGREGRSQVGDHVEMTTE